MKLWVDIETRSAVPIRHGTAKYATDVEVILLQYAIDDDPVYVVDILEKEPPDDFTTAAQLADEIWAHNAEFDRTMLQEQAWWRALGVPLETWRCTAALARMHGLPGGLEKLSAIFHLGESDAKDHRGHQLIQIFCIPNKLGHYNNATTHPKEWKEFMGYGGQDVIAMRAVYKKCPKWNATPDMWAKWHLDQKMNPRGIAVDLKLCEGAVNATTKAKRKLAGRTDELTLGVVEATTQRNRLLAFMSDYGVDLPDLTADTVERRLEDESLPEAIKELLRIRQQASKASTAKYKRVLTHHTGGRLRNMLVFCGAARTGRFSGRTIQPHNLPRPKHERWEIEQGIEAFHCDSTELFDPEDVLGLAASCLRGMFVAEKGRKLVVSDLANIEGRGMAWVVGEEWKLKAFAAYDRKEGPDLYKVSYARPFNIDPNDIGDDDPRRQIGKVMELALQYYGGVGAFCAMAETYGLRLEELAATAWPIIPRQFKEKAQANYSRAIKRRRTYGLEERVWLVCEALVLMWRQAHPATVGFWHSLEKAIKTALISPHRVIQVGRISVDRVDNWLRLRLPSGRFLSYPSPREDEDGASFIGVNPYTKQWGRISTYSGKFAENVIQALAADILLDGLMAAEKAGYNPVLSVHDEIITEPADSAQFTEQGLSRLMVGNSPWAQGLPLAAKGFTAYRYRK